MGAQQTKPKPHWESHSQNITGNARCGNGGFRAPETKQNPFCLHRNEGRVEQGPPLGTMRTCCPPSLPYHPTLPSTSWKCSLGMTFPKSSPALHTYDTSKLRAPWAPIWTASPDHAGLGAHPDGLQSCPFPMLVIPCSPVRKGSAVALGFFLQM